MQVISVTIAHRLTWDQWLEIKHLTEKALPECWWCTRVVFPQETALWEGPYTTETWTMHQACKREAVDEGADGIPPEAWIAGVGAAV